MLPSYKKKVSFFVLFGFSLDFSSLDACAACFFARTLASPKLLCLGKVQINLAFLSTFRNFAGIKADNMKIGIIVAMDKELRQLQKLFSSEQVRVASEK